MTRYGKRTYDDPIAISPTEQAVLDAVMPIIHTIQDGAALAPRCPFCDHLVSKHNRNGCCHRVSLNYADDALWWATSGLCACNVGVEDPPEPKPWPIEAFTTGPCAECGAAWVDGVRKHVLSCTVYLAIEAAREGR